MLLIYIKIFNPLSIHQFDTMWDEEIYNKKNSKLELYKSYPKPINNIV